MAHSKTEAIVLNCFDYSESSQIVHLLSPTLGKVHVIAKGIKRNKSYGVFDLFTHGSVVLLSRKQGGEDDLKILVELSVISSFQKIRTRSDRIHAALHALEITSSCAQEANPEPELFDLLLRLLTSLGNLPIGQLRVTMLLYSLRFLEVSGFAPNWSGCFRCDRPLKVCTGTLRFLPGSGGFACSSCGAPDDSLFVRVQTKTIELLAELSGPSHSKPKSVTLPERPLREMEQITLLALQASLDRQLRVAPILNRYLRKSDHK